MGPLTTLRVCLTMAAVCTFAQMYSIMHDPHGSMPQVYVLFTATVLFLAGLPIAR